MINAKSKIKATGLRVVTAILTAGTMLGACAGAATPVHAAEPAALEFSTLDLSKFAPGNGLKIEDKSTSTTCTVSGGSLSDGIAGGESTGNCNKKVSGLGSESTVVIDYGDIGSYGGQRIGVKATFSDFTRISDFYYCDSSFYNGWWFFREGDSSRVKATFDYYYTDGGQAVDFDGQTSFMTFNSLNNAEFVSPLNGNTVGYVASDTVLAIKDMLGTPSFVGTNDGDWTDYLGGSTFYRASVKIPLSGTSNAFYLGAGDRNYWIAPSSASIGIPQPKDPVKTENGVTKLEETEVGEELVYRISHTVPVLGVDTISVYSALKYVDVLPEEVDYVSCWMEDGNGDKIDTGSSSYDKDTRKLVYTFSDDYLKNSMAYAGETYTLVINTTVNGETDADTFTNRARVYVNSMYVDSNLVEAVAPYRSVAAIVENGSISITDKDGKETVTGDEDTKVDQKIKFNTDRTVSYEPDEGYLLASVTVDGKAVDITKYPSSYIFESITKDHEIKVVYEKPSVEKTVRIKDSECIDRYEEGQEIDKTVIKDGDTVTYTIAFTNPTSAVRNVTVKDPVPEGAEVTTDSISDGGSYDAKSRTITWSGTVKAHGTGKVSFSCVMQESAQDTIVKNTGTVTLHAIDGRSEKNVTLKDTTESPILKDPVKSIRNSDGEDITYKVINDDTDLTYVIRFENPSEETKVFTVTDEIPEGLTLKEGTISDQGAAENGTVTWKLTLAGGESKEVTYGCHVNTITSDYTKIYNQADVSVDHTHKTTVASEAVAESVPDGYTPIYVLDKPVKMVLCEDGHNIGSDENGAMLQTVKQAGDILEYRICFKNPADDAREFTITDVLPENVEFVSVEQGGIFDTGTRMVTWNVTIDENTESYVSVKVRIRKEAEDTILKNRATVSVDLATKETNEVETPVLPTPVKDVLSKLGESSINTCPVQIGEDIFYTVSYTNPSDLIKTAVIKDKLPEDVKFLSASEGGTYDANTHTVTWSMETEAHTEGSVWVKVKVLSGAGNKTIENRATVSMDEASVKTITHNGDEEEKTTRNFVPGKNSSETIKETITNNTTTNNTTTNNTTVEKTTDKSSTSGTGTGSGNSSSGNTASGGTGNSSGKSTAGSTESGTASQNSNTLRSTDGPKTGDDFRLGFWLAIGGIALAAGIGCGIYAIRRKK